jgi:hypothetical protein
LTNQLPKKGAMPVGMKRPPSNAESPTPSGSQLSETSTYLDATFASLGLTPGAYVFRWGVDDPSKLFTVKIGVPSPVPEPSTWAMMLLGFAGLGRCRRSD